MNINDVTLDEFNLVCYVSMYASIRQAISFLKQSPGNSL